MKISEYRSIGLFAAVIAFFLVSPLLSRGPRLEASISIVFSFVIGFFGYLLSPSRRWLIGVAGISMIALCFFLLKSIFQESRTIGLSYQLALLGILLLTLSHCLRFAL